MDEATRQLKKSADKPTNELARLIKRAQENPAFQKKVRDNLETIAGATPEELKQLSLETLNSTLDLAPYLSGEGRDVYSKHAKTLLNLLVNIRKYEHDKQNEKIHAELDFDNFDIGAAIAQLEAGSHIQQKMAEKDARIAQLEQLALKNDEETRILRNKSIRDKLTGLYNRAYFDETFHQEVKEAKRYHESPLSVIMFDIDFFKKINDTYLHDGGDYVLHTLPTCFPFRRASDIICRYGGEEFIAVLPETHEGAAYELAEELRTNVAKHDFSYRGVSIPVTISLGVAQFQPHEDEDGFKRRVDTLLYTAKRLGRNATCSWADWGASIELGAKHE